MVNNHRLKIVFRNTFKPRSPSVSTVNNLEKSDHVKAGTCVHSRRPIACADRYVGILNKALSVSMPAISYYAEHCYSANVATAMFSIVPNANVCF